jgi:SAM-dependent methyltransferase
VADESVVAQTQEAREVAIEIFRMKRQLGLRKAVGGLDYGRCAEYPAALARLELGGDERVLEIGSSKLFLGCHIALQYGVEVYVTDPDPVVWHQWPWMTKLGGEESLLEGRFVIAQQDATRLRYRDVSFDRVVSVSTIEHIRDVESAVREIHRVLKPGGLAVLTVPFSRTGKETWVEHSVYNRRYDGTPLFYEYLFDADSLEQRLVAPSRLRLRSLSFLGEPGFKMTRLVYHKLLGPPLTMFRWIWPYTAHRWYREIEPDEVSSSGENVAVLTLEKPA